ncbi:MAG: UDP-N-acetylmuramoyl-L-alanine--D-glutamate ligase [Candidatus Scatovivens sp.]
MSFINKKLIEFNEFLQEKRIAIIGINFHNIKLIEYLYNIQADEVMVFDKREIEYINGDLMDKVITCGMEFSLGKDCFRKLNGFNIIFRAPNYLPTIPEVLKEEENGAIITSELEMFMELCPAKIIGIAGTDGKTTTAEMIYDILKNGECTCYIGGFENLSIFSQIEKINPEDIVVLKLSNEQLMNMKISPEISIITNMNLTDLNIEYSEEEYIGALKNIFLNQNENGTLILNYDNETIREFSKEAKGRTIFFSENKIEEGYIIAENKIKVCEGELRIHLLDTRNLNLRGVHNFKNATCAIIATSDFVDLEVSINTIKSFNNIENRLELIYETENRIKWYNDSASITPSRTITSLDAFALRNIILITGGDNNNLDYEKLATPIINSCKALILNGENSDIIEEYVIEKLRNTGNKIKIYKTNNIKESIIIANDIATTGDIVLFSPASNCDNEEYKDYEQKGEIFKEIVLNNIFKE